MVQVAFGLFGCPHYATPTRGHLQCSTEFDKDKHRPRIYVSVLSTECAALGPLNWIFPPSPLHATRPARLRSPRHSHSIQTHYYSVNTCQTFRPQPTYPRRRHRLEKQTNEYCQRCSVTGTPRSLTIEAEAKIGKGLTYAVEVACRSRPKAQQRLGFGVYQRCRRSIRVVLTLCRGLRDQLGWLASHLTGQPPERFAATTIWHVVTLRGRLTSQSVQSLSSKLTI